MFYKNKIRKLEKKIIGLENPYKIQVGEIVNFNLPWTKIKKGIVVKRHRNFYDNPDVEFENMYQVFFKEINTYEWISEKNLSK